MLYLCAYNIEKHYIYEDNPVTKVLEHQYSKKYTYCFNNILNILQTMNNNILNLFSSFMSRILGCSSYSLSLMH